MKVMRFLKKAVPALVVLVSLKGSAPGQFITAGSTPEGDYLRGVGLEAWGMGLYNLNTAQADSINLDTAIRWNEYLDAVAKEQSREYVARKVAEATKEKEFYKQNRQRLLDSPEARDVASSDALNRVLEELMNSNLGESALRTQQMQVNIPVDLIRHIPFKLGEKGEQFSMDRIMLKAKGTRTPGLQDHQFDIVFKRYAIALDKVLEQAIDGKMQLAAIDELADRADDMLRRLDEVIPPSSDRLYIEAKDRLNEIKTTVRQLKTAKVERAIGDIDKYSGTTINDLTMFMRTHDLRFAAAKTVEEKAKCPELYAFLREQLDKAKTAGSEPIK